MTQFCYTGILIICRQKDRKVTQEYETNVRFFAEGGWVERRNMGKGDNRNILDHSEQLKQKR